MEKVWSFGLACATVVMAVATALLGITLPAMWAMSKDIGTLTAKADAAEKRLESLDTKADPTLKRIEGVDFRLAQRESDPAALVAQAGFREQ